MNLTVKEVLERYGPALAMIAALIGLVVFIPSNAQDDELGTNAGFDSAADGPQDLLDTGNSPLETGSESTTVTTSGATVSGGANSGSGGDTGPSTAPEATAPTDTTPSTDTAPPPANTNCREDGRMPDFSQYSPTCVPVFAGDNGGATSQGVTADAVKIVWYNDQEDQATQAALTGAGAGDSDEIRESDLRTFIRYYNTHYETYGREIQLEIFEGTGDPLDDNVLRADATAIANNMKPFAVFHHTVSMGSAFSEELAAKGIVCLCTTSSPRSFYAETAPYTYTILPVLDEYYSSIAEYVGKRLNGRAPQFAGAAPPGRVGFNETRKFGLIFLEGRGSDVNPRVQPVVDKFEQELAQYGAKLEIAIGYQYDIGAAPQQSTNIMAQLINAGVNHVIFVGDPLYPIFLTQAADNQQYNPEWLITGTGLTDTTFFGRTYSQKQWQHAFGFSPLWVFAPLSQSSGYNSHDHIAPGTEKGVGVNVHQSPIQLMTSGVHYAGPNLTPQTFAQGLFAADPVGGTINAPLVKFTAENPGALKDWVEVWWDPTRRGMDEQDRQGAGMLVKANGGARYQTGQWPQDDPYVFGNDPDGITTTDKAEILPHGADGHNHDNDPPCRSCG